MIELVPELKTSLSCPLCFEASDAYKRVFFQGIRVLVDVTCPKCSCDYLHDLPVGHAVNYPCKLEKSSGKVAGTDKSPWFKEQLEFAFKNEITVIPRSIKKGKDKKKVIILNCIDYLYGHVLLKLFNASFYKQLDNETGLVVIIPSSFEWLVPESVMEVWSVNIKLSQARYTLKGLDEFIQKEVSRFEKVYLSPVYSHPDLQKVKIEEFTGVKPLEVKNISEGQPPVVTFINRQDRLWHSGKLEYFLFLVTRKLNLLPIVKGLFFSRQISRINQLYDTIKVSFPDCHFNVIGLGRFGSFKNGIHDFRLKTMSPESERKWCETYAQSHLVIGIHGSNMLLPTAHAGGFVEILPEDRIGNITQDVFCRYNSRNMLFWGRFLQGYAPVKEVSNHIISILRGRKDFSLKSDEKYLKYNSEFNSSEYIIE